MRTNSNKTTIRSLARLWLATLLIFNACSNGSSGGGGNSGGGGGYEGDMVGCKYIEEVWENPLKGSMSGGYVCLELLANNIPTNELKADCERKQNGQYYDGGCPSGVLKCPGSGEKWVNAYLYGNEFIGVTCNEFFNAW